MSGDQQSAAAQSGRSLGGRLAGLLPSGGPQRTLILSSLIASVGLGLYTSGVAIYFVRSVGLSAPQVGLGLSIAGLVSLPIGVPIGRIADRVGSRDVTVALTWLQAVVLILAAFVTTFPLFVVAISVLGIASAGANVTRSAMVSAVVGTAERVRMMAYQRSVFNIGFSAGVFGSGVVIGIDTKPAYLVLILGNALTAIVTGLLTLRLPRVPGKPRHESVSMSRTLRDLPYLSVAVSSSVTRFGDIILTVGLPLWVITQTDAPRPLAAWLIGVNTILVILLQVRASRIVDEPGGSVKGLRLAMVALALACLALAPTDRLGLAMTIGLLLVAVLLLTAGELWGESARWALRYNLAPAAAQGAYGGVFSLGSALPMVLGPLLVTGVLDRLGPGGWLILAAIFLLAMPLVGPTISWAERSRVQEVDEAVSDQ